jgi:hypothetical protein
LRHWIESSLAQGGHYFTLSRVHADGNEEIVATPASFEEGWDAGTTAAHAEPTMAFSLYRPNGSRVA